MAQFIHPWLTEEFAEESRRQAESEDSKAHHYVPRFYLQRWAVDGLVQPIQVDTRSAFDPQPPRAVGHKKNLYSIPASSDTMDLPLKWVEKHLSRIETDCVERFKQLDSIGAGKVTDAPLKRDMAVFLALQLTRTPAQRTRTLTIVQGPESAKREWLKRTRPHLSEDLVREVLKPKYADPKREALYLMLADVRNGLARALFKRWWVVYQTNLPIATCDDPVVAVAGPPWPRANSVGAQESAAILYPLGPHHLLVMLRPDLRHREPYELDSDETAAVNLEIVAAATKTAFERPGDGIALSLAVPPRTAAEQQALDAEELDPAEALALLLYQATPRNRWAKAEDGGPAWPIPRWYP